MAAWTPFDSHLKDLYDTFWDTNQSKPTAFSVILTTSSTWDETDNTATVTGTEVSTGNGYTEGGVTLASHASTVDGAQDRTEGRPAAVTFTASGGDITFDGVVVVATIDAADAICLFRKYSSTQTIADGESRDFTVELNLGSAAADVEAA